MPINQTTQRRNAAKDPLPQSLSKLVGEGLFASTSVRGISPMKYQPQLIIRAYLSASVDSRKNAWWRFALLVVNPSISAISVWLNNSGELVR